MTLNTNLINNMSEYKRDELLSEAYGSTITKYDISDNYKHLIPLNDLPKIRIFMSSLKRGIPPQKETNHRTRETKHLNKSCYNCKFKHRFF